MGNHDGYVCVKFFKANAFQVSSVCLRAFLKDPWTSHYVYNFVWIEHNDQM